MKHSYLFPVALAVVALILGAVYMTTSSTPTDRVSLPAPEVSVPQANVPEPGDTSKSPTPTTTVEPTPTVTGMYSMTDIATHASAQRCWTTINGNVYDVTAWIAKHPGGASAILSLCGTDGSASFSGQHGGQRRPEAELASFKIGTLK